MPTARNTKKKGGRRWTYDFISLLLFIFPPCFLSLSLSYFSKLSLLFVVNTSPHPACGRCAFLPEVIPFILSNHPSLKPVNTLTTAHAAEMEENQLFHPLRSHHVPSRTPHFRYVCRLLSLICRIIDGIKIEGRKVECDIDGSIHRAMEKETVRR